MRAPASAAAIAALVLSVTGCGAPDFGSEPSSYSSNWPHAEPEAIDSASPDEPTEEPSSTQAAQDEAEEPSITLPNSIGGEVREGSKSNGMGAFALPFNVTQSDIAYGAGARTLTVYVYAGSKSGIKSVVRAHKQRLGGSRVGRSICAAKPSVKICWRADDVRVVSVTGSAKRSLGYLAAAADGAWRAQTPS